MVGLYTLRKRACWLAAIAIAAFVMLKLLDHFLAPPLHLAKPGVVVTDHKGQWLHAFPARVAQDDNRWRFQADLDEIDPAFIERLIAVEDRRFYQHGGVDLKAVMRAFISMIKEGEVVSGASTITMQSARLLEPRPRTFRSKFIEMLRAWQLESRLSKREILELYLTLAPYGGNIEGVRSASLSYFKKEPGYLTDAQQALLIALPQAPEARRPDRRPMAAKSSRDNVLDLLVEKGVLSRSLAAEARQAHVPQQRFPFKKFAWHSAYRAQSELAGGGEIATTIDRDSQIKVERLLRRVAKGIEDGASLAAIVVDNKNHAIRVSVGSADRSLDGGWIDMTLATRSPGSTLKPLIYGLAFDDGIVDENSIIVDTSYSFDGYRPENFSRMFRGEVSVTEALQHSLNVPAVLTLDKVGADRFVASLAAAGLAAKMPRRADRKASLAVALGGVGLSAKDLAVLYAGLANSGTVQPLSWLPAIDQSNQQSFQLISADSARRLERVMQQSPAVAGRSPSQLSTTAPRVAFKTGTSYGYRDAWAVGFTRKYTVVIWAGHANGTPRPGVTGRRAALPVMFDIFDMLEQNRRQPRPQQPTQTFETGQLLSQFSTPHAELPPEIIFPESGIEILMSNRRNWTDLKLAARGGVPPYRWFVDGIALESVDAPLWKPSGQGFYKVTIVDSRGMSSSSEVSVATSFERSKI